MYEESSFQKDQLIIYEKIDIFFILHGTKENNDHNQENESNATYSKVPLDVFLTSGICSWFFNWIVCTVIC